jgi:hypothetical protein
MSEQDRDNDGQGFSRGVDLAAIALDSRGRILILDERLLDAVSGAAQQAAVNLLAEPLEDTNFGCPNMPGCQPNVGCR